MCTSFFNVLEFQLVTLTMYTNTVKEVSIQHALEVHKKKNNNQNFIGKYCVSPRV